MIKNTLKKVLPLPAENINKRFEEISTEIEYVRNISSDIKSKNDEQLQKIKTIFNDLKKVTAQVADIKQLGESEKGRLGSISSQIENYATLLKEITLVSSACNKTIDTVSGQLNYIHEREKISSQRIDSIHKELEIVSQSASSLKRELIMRSQINQRTQKEILWSKIFTDTIKGTFLERQSLSLGRWAIGYPCAYILFRCLQVINPTNILELGLGESTKIISAFCQNSNIKISHCLIENNPTWIDFFKKSNPNVLDGCEIFVQDYEFIKYRDYSDVRVFKDFSKRLKGRKFSLISVDAPLGGDMKNISRIDILEIIPEGLEKSFVILIDDYNRPQEKCMVKELKDKLTNSNVQFTTGLYSGEKDCIVVCSPDLSFLCSL